MNHIVAIFHHLDLVPVICAVLALLIFWFFLRKLLVLLVVILVAFVILSWVDPTITSELQSMVQPILPSWLRVE
jgi:hypothetical protein